MKNLYLIYKKEVEPKKHTNIHDKVVSKKASCIISFLLTSSLVERIRVIPTEAVIPRLIINDIHVELSLITSAIRGKSINALNANNRIPNTFSITLKLSFFIN